MSIKKLIASVNAQNKDIKKVKDICIKYANNDADEIYIYNFSDDEKEKEELLSLAREISKVIDTPFMLGMRINRLEDIKKILYTGAKYALIDLNVQDDINIIKEGSERFGKEKIIVKPTDTKKEHIDKIKEYYEDWYYYRTARNVRGLRTRKHPGTGWEERTGRNPSA